MVFPEILSCRAVQRRAWELARGCKFTLLLLLGMEGLAKPRLAQGLWERAKLASLRGNARSAGPPSVTLNKYKLFT